MPADSRDNCERRAGFCERCGYRRCDAFSVSPARGEGDAPVAWSPNGGEYGCPPILPPDTQVLVLRRSGDVTGPYPAGRIEWHHQNVPSDPMFYRPFHPTPATPAGEELREALDNLRDEVAAWSPEENAGHDVGGDYYVTDFLSVKDLRTILAALQPQAEGE